LWERILEVGNRLPADSIPLHGSYPIDEIPLKYVKAYYKDALAEPTGHPGDE